MPSGKRWRINGSAPNLLHRMALQETGCVWATQLAPPSARQSACMKVSTDGRFCCGSTITCGQIACTSSCVICSRSTSSKMASIFTWVKPPSVIVPSWLPDALTQNVPSSPRALVLPSPSIAR